MHADLCQIYTDVDGVYTADPRKIPAARKLDVISYDEMLELATLGAAIFDWRPRFSDLPEEVKAYLTEHENEIRSAGDVERLVRTYEMKK